MLAVDFSPILEFTLKCLSQQRVEWLLLASANIKASQRKRNDQFKALKVVSGLGSLNHILGSK